MSLIDYPITVPPIPLPQITVDEGIPPIPDYVISSSGSIGESSIDSIVPNFEPQQIGYSDADTPVRHSFQIVSVGSDVILNPGLVNGIVLTDTQLNNRSGTNNFVVLDITVNSNGVSSVSASVDTSAPNGIDFVKNGVNTSFKYPIAIVDNDRLVAQLVFTNLFFTPRIAYEEPKSSINVGEYPNDIYYSWQAVNA